ncbi:hypothetical protein G6R40_11030 [Chryseobacterium sp. POL2]|uniref:GEVED domain-containing protein n=1 Tax=Chryseobacterium sp. POL2 TaxID=2713414 RepID=UPI0013E1F67F|nr:GEVED domain-containing protein [Chryseobacterium sp. POL2]QIG90160.1 hypothetical protein G6R40_11030 [Chryseobacterium sp. POL2]
MSNILSSKILKKTLIAFVLLLSLSSWGQNKNEQVLSQALTNSSTEMKTSDKHPLEMMKGKIEDISKRTADAKHFKNKDGSYTAVIGAGAMHYQKNGKWEDIDTKIKKNNSQDFPFANTSNLMESHFGASSNKGIISKTKEGEVKEFLNGKMYWEANGNAVNTQEAADVKATVDGDKIYYHNLFGKISAEYIVKTGQRKLNYIIPSKADLGNVPAGAEYLVFEEEIILPKNFNIVNGIKKYNKLKKEYQTIPGIYVLNTNEEAIMEYSAPEIIENYNSEVAGLPSQLSPEISFEKIGNIFILYTKVKADWILANERIFPIAIDPTATAYPFTTNFSTGQTYNSNGGNGNIAAGYSGGWYRGWATFNLTSLPSLSNVTAVNVSLYISNKGGSMGPYVSESNTNSINIGHTSYDLSRLVWLNNYANLYTAITDPGNTRGAYNYMPNQNIGTWANVSLNPGTTTAALSEVEKKSGNNMAFFPVSFSPGWGSGTTTKFYVIAGYADANKPYLTITYNAVDKYKHSAHTYANAAAYKDIGYIQIGNVTLGSINNTTAITSTSANNNADLIYRNTPTGYNRYNLSTNVNSGNSYTLNATYRDIGSPYNSGKVAVWVDWNEDGDFADANEYIGVSANTTSGNQVLAFNISVPSGTSAGTKRLRVRSAYDDQSITSANYDTTFEYGETEDYDLVVLGDPTLTVSNAYIGASHADGNYTIANNTSVTATSGTRAGYNVTGWTGTGSVPATGTGDTANFTITQNSSISWIWEQLAVKNLQFHNYGGTEPLAFNNSRIDTTTPKFRLSHQAEEANEYQIEINSNPTFAGGTNWGQNFTGTFNTNTENNFTFTNAFSPSNNTTYYVRARAKASVNNEWSDWTTEAYSFTYQTPKTNPDWFQTTQAQFQSNSLSGVIADASHDVITASGGNRVVNGDFSNGTNDWTVTGTSGQGKTASIVNTPESSFPGNWLRLGSNFGYSGSGTIVVSQQIDLTNVSQITFNAGNYYSVGGPFDANPNSKAEFKIGGTLTDTSGTLEATITQQGSGQGYSYHRQDKTVDVSSYTGVHVIKFVMTYNANWHGNGTLYYFFADVKAESPPAGTITSTPIHLASVQEATAYQGITWNQSLGGGTLALKVQSSTDGVNFSDIAGYTNITESGDGEKFFDLSGLTPAPPNLRLVGTLDGQNVKMHDWAVAFVKELPCDKTWTGTSSTDWHTPDNWLPIGVPTNKNCVKIPNTFNKPVVSSLATAFAQSLELQEFANLKILSGASISIKNEITNHGDESNFVIEDIGSLVQEENLSNTGKITYNRNTAQAWAKDFIYLGSPVSNAQFSQISNEPGKNFGAFYHWLSSPTPGEAGKWSSAIAGNSVNTMTAAQGYIARVPNNWNAATIYKMNFKGIPNNGDITIPFKTGARQDVVSTNDVNEAYQDKWVLLANPYPSAIDALEMLNLQSNKDLLFDSGNPSNPYNSDGALYFWNHKDGTGAMQNPFYNNGTNYSSDPSNHYILKNFTGTTPIETPINNSPSGNWNGKIPAAQAFFIRGKENADGHFSFTNSMRVTGENDSYYKNNEKHRFWLDLTKKDNNKSAQTLIGYVDGASNGLDFMYDGLSMDNDLDIYTNIMGKNLSIQGRSLPFDSQDIVTLGYTAPQTGAYRIGLFQTEGLFAPHGIQTIYLKDKSNGIIHNLIDAPYEFVTDTGRYNDRFEIVYEKTTLTTENIQKTQLNIIYDDLQKRWLILSPQHKILKIEIYDLSGKLIWIKKALNTTAFSIPYRHVNQKTALIKVHTDNVEVVTKKIINP